MADFTIEIHKGAARDLDSAPRDTRERIVNKLRDMVTDEWRDLTDYDVKKLGGTRNDIYRTRIGDWRIVFAVDEDEVTIVIVGGDKRSGVYRNTDQFDDRADDYVG